MLKQVMYAILLLTEVVTSRWKTHSWVAVMTQIPGADIYNVSSPKTSPVSCELRLEDVRL